MWINVLLVSIILVCGITLLIVLIWRQQQLILAQKQLELNKALLKSQAIHKSILHTVMDGFLLMNMQGRLLEVNEPYCRVSGYSEQELLAMEIVDLDVLLYLRYITKI
jgi:PAS domain-containing protein